MPFVFHCADIDTNCPARFVSDSDVDLLVQIHRHVDQAHPELAKKKPTPRGAEEGDQAEGVSAMRSIASPSTTRHPGKRRKTSGSTRTFVDRLPPPTMTVGRSEHPGVDVQRQSRRDAERRHAAEHHPGQPGRLLRRGEGQLPDSEQVGDTMVHVQAGRGQHQAQGVDLRLAAARHQDGVGRVLGVDAVPGTELGGVGERRIAGQHLVPGPGRVERGPDGCLDASVVRRGGGSVIGLGLLAAVRRHVDPVDGTRSPAGCPC